MKCFALTIFDIYFSINPILIETIINISFVFAYRVIVVAMMLASVGGAAEEIIDAGSGGGAARHFPAGDKFADAAIRKETSGVVGTKSRRHAICRAETRSVTDMKRH